VPALYEAKLWVPALVFSHATSSFISFAGTVGATTRTIEARATTATGFKSVIGSKLPLSTCGTSVSTLLADIMSVWPSGGAASRLCTAITPPAPGLLSTTTGWPIWTDNWSASARATMSAVPPAGAGTMMRTGLPLNAKAGAASANAAVIARPVRSCLFVVMCRFSLNVELFCGRRLRDQAAQQVEGARATRRSRRQG
jgi:hypothetical protein